MLLQDYVINTYKDNFHHAYNEIDGKILKFFEYEYENDQISFVELLQKNDENNLSVVIFIRIFKLIKTYSWLDRNNLCHYSLTDQSIINTLKLDHKTSFEECDIKTNLYFLGVTLSLDRWVVIDDRITDLTPYVYIKENEDAAERRILIDAFIKITGIKHFQNAIFIPEKIKNLFNPIMEQDIAKINLLQNPHDYLTLVDHGKPMNYSVIARNDLPECFTLLYNGKIYDEKVTHIKNDNFYVMSARSDEEKKYVYAYEFEAEKHRGFSGFFAHLPKDKHLDQFNIIPGVKIATANLESNQITLGDLSFTILSSIKTKKIYKDQPIGISYGKGYFESRGLIMRFFDIDGYLLPLRLCYPKTFAFRTTHDVLKDMSLESLWHIVKKNKFLLATCEESKKQILLKADEVKKLLLQQYAYPNVSEIVVNDKNFQAKSALMRACIDGDFDMVWYLCEFHHGLIDIKNKNIALHFAVKHKHLDIIRYLLSMGIDVEVKDENNLSALDIAKQNNLNEKKALRIIEILEFYNNRVKENVENIA